MSKTSLKKILKELNAQQLTEVILDMYDARKDAREYLEYFANPNEEKMADKTRAIIDKEFFPLRGEGKARVSVCRRAIKDFMLLHPSPRLIAEVKYHYVERAVAYGFCWRWHIRESVVNGMITAWRDLLDYCYAQGLLDAMYPAISVMNSQLKTSRSYDAREMLAVYAQFCADNGLTEAN